MVKLETVTEPCAPDKPLTHRQEGWGGSATSATGFAYGTATMVLVTLKVKYACLIRRYSWIFDCEIPRALMG